MPKPYSEDLRWVAVWNKIFYRKRDEEIARQLFICPESVRRFCRLYRRTGSVLPRRVGRPKGSTTLVPHEEYILVDAVLRRPEGQLAEIADEIWRTTGNRYNNSTICRALHRLGITRKKLHQVSIRRREDLRITYLAEMAVFQPEQLVFVDECGIDTRLARKYGYSVRGQNAVRLSTGPFYRGAHVSVISAISLDGLIAVKVLPQGKYVDADVFIDFLQNNLMPFLNRYDGASRRSVVVMDNHPIHHVAEVPQIVYGAGCLLRYLPPYSPDFSPIEESYHQVKHFIRQNDNVFHVTMNKSAFILYAFGQITSSDCVTFFKDCNYLV